MLELKALSKDALPAAIEKAKHYRLLNEPRQAESICRDVLAVDPDNEEALITMLLALTDQFVERQGPAVKEARELLSKLGDEYHRRYYAGIVLERRARALLRLNAPRCHHAAYERLRAAMERFESAAEIRPAGNDEAILRWNTCARQIADDPRLESEPEETFEALLE